MIKFVVIALGIFIVYKLFANDFLHKKKKDEKISHHETEKKAAAGELVKDPICGTYVSVADSISVKDGDTVHRFCSYDCRDSFIKKLEKERRTEAITEDTGSKNA